MGRDCVLPLSCHLEKYYFFFRLVVFFLVAMIGLGRGCVCERRAGEWASVEISDDALFKGAGERFAVGIGVEPAFFVRITERGDFGEDGRSLDAEEHDERACFDPPVAHRSVRLADRRQQASLNSFGQLA